MRVVVLTPSFRHTQDQTCVMGWISVWMWALAWAGGDLGPTSWALIWSPSTEARLSASQQLHAEADRTAVGAALIHTLAWDPDRRESFVGTVPLIAALEVSEPHRIALATELMAWWLQLASRGDGRVPDRLSVELRGLLQPEIDRYGEPTATSDWLHLLGSAGGELGALLARMERDRGRWVYVQEENQALRSGDLSDVLPLLAHRSLIVRTRAARRFEATPEASKAALRHAWRFAPGRVAPLRGEVAVPSLPWEEGPAIRWARVLTRWARRTARQRDDRALRATLWLLCAPELSSAMPASYREQHAKVLVRAAKRDVRSTRSADLGQGMDALLRQVPFPEGARPAPDEHLDLRETWKRQHPEL